MTVVAEGSLGPRPRLLLGLGNPLMGDDGVGWHVVERLRDSPLLPSDVDLAWGGTDLLGCAALVEGRGQVLLVDATTSLPPGEVARLHPERDELDERSTGAHALSLPGALRLLEILIPGFAAEEVVLLGVGVVAVGPGDRLSAFLEARLPGIVEDVLALVAASRSAPAVLAGCVDAG